MCPGSKNVFDLRQKHFLVSEQQNLFPQHMFPTRLNWETFASATVFPSLARPSLTVSYFHSEPLPEPWNTDLDAFQKLLVLKCLRADKVTNAMQVRKIMP